MRGRDNPLNLGRCRHREQFSQNQDDQFRQGQSTPSRTRQQLDPASLAGGRLFVSNSGVNLRSQHVGAVEELGELSEGGGNFVG